MNKIIPAVLLAAFASSAFAADEGFYIGANIGQSSTDKVMSKKTATAYSLLAGYQFMKYVAAEIQWNDMGSPTLTGGASAKIDGYSAKAVGIYPITSQWSIFGKLGYAHMKMGGIAATSKNDITYGIGGQYNITSNWGVNVNYDMYSVKGPAPLSQKATTSVPSIGVAYNF